MSAGLAGSIVMPLALSCSMYQPASSLDLAVPAASALRAQSRIAACCSGLSPLQAALLANTELRGSQAWVSYQ